MSEWWTYSLSDFLLFSPRTYRHLIELYNAQAWPLHLLALAIGIGLVVLQWHRGAHTQRLVALGLAACWGWVGFAFFARHYASINWAASYVAAAFGLQAAMFAIAGGLSARMQPPNQAPGVRWSAASLLGFGLLLQPLIGPLLGRPWTQMEVFGMAPDPTVTLTLGVLATWPLGRLNIALWVIPLLWCATSAATLWTMHDPDAWVMPAVAALALVSRSRR